MKTSEIEVGGRYRVRLSEEQALVYRGCAVEATVVRAGFHYDVTYTAGSRVRGAPFVRQQRSEHPNGVEVRWEEQQVPGNTRHVKVETVHAGHAIGQRPRRPVAGRDLTPEKPSCRVRRRRKVRS